MVNVNKLKGLLVEKGLNVEFLAEKIDVDRSTLYRRLTENGSTFTIKEADKIAKVLDLTCEEATSIFFAQFVA